MAISNAVKCEINAISMQFESLKLFFSMQKGQFSMLLFANPF